MAASGKPVKEPGTGAPNAATSRPRIVRAPATDTCWPTIARTRVSHGSTVVGTRRPGRAATIGRSAGSAPSAAPTVPGSASRSSHRRTRRTSVAVSRRSVSLRTTTWSPTTRTSATAARAPSGTTRRCVQVSPSRSWISRPATERAARNSPTASASYGGRSRSRSTRAGSAAAIDLIGVRRSADGGDPNSRRMTSLNCRMLEKPAANAISASGSSVCSMSSRAVCARRLTASCSGPAPTSATSVRCRCRSLTCSVRASATTPPSSTAPSAMSRSARPARSPLWSQCRDPGAESGRHRLQARKPALTDPRARDPEPDPAVETPVAARERLVGRLDVEPGGRRDGPPRLRGRRHAQESASRPRHPAGGKRTPTPKPDRSD